MMTTSRLSLHIQQHVTWPTNASWVKVIDPPSENKWPGKRVIGRVFMPDHESQALINQGGAGAVIWARYCQDNWRRSPWVWCWEAPNEPYVNDLASCRALAEFTSTLAGIMHGMGLRLVGGCLAEGNPGGDESERRARFQILAPALAACDYWSQHCYFVPEGYPHPEAGLTDWHAYRYRMNVQYAADMGITLPPLLITEAGIDGGVVGRPQTGWKSYCASREAYMEQLAQFDAGLQRDAYVQTATIFTAGAIHPWGDFDVDEPLNVLINRHIEAQEQNDMTKVYDVGGAERDLAWLAANYDGCHPEYVKDKMNVSGYSHTFRLVAIYCTEGPATAKGEIRDANGQPKSGNFVVLSWPSLANPSGDLPDLTGSGAPYVWTARGVAQATDGGGMTGFGLGQAYGPLYQMWVLSPSTPSDCLVATGMKGGTVHRGPLHAVFAYTPTGVNPPPPPGPDPEPPDDLARLVALAVPQMAGNRSPATIAQRSIDTLALLREAAE
jgi:hypothetical protein